MSPKAEPLPRRELQWYALGSLPAGVNALGYSYLVFYYNQVLGIPGSAIGIAAVVISFFDAITDPVAGAISDRSTGRLGRRHGFLLWSALPMALCFYLTWAPPAGMGMTALMVFLLVLHLANRLASTFYTVPYLALGAEITKDYEERTRLVTARNVYFHIGRAVAGALLLVVFLAPTEDHPNGQLNPDGYPAFGAVFGLFILAALFASAWFTRAWIPRLSTARPSAHRGLRQLFGEFREALRYRAFRALLFGSIARHVAWGVAEALGLYMATYFWQVSTEILFLWGCGMFAGLFIGLPFWQAMARRFDKKPICMIGDVSYFLFFCSPYLLKIVGFWPDPESPFYIPLYVLTTGFLAHFGIAAAGAVFGSMLGDVTDLDECEGGRRREGVIFGAESFSWKALTGLGSLVAGVVVDVVGLSESVSPEAIPETTVTALGLAQGGSMALLFALALVFTSRYDLDRIRHREVLAALATRTAK